MNKILLNEKYKNLILPDKGKFIEEVNFIKSKINFNNLQSIPLLVYGENKRHALYYTLCMFFSLKHDRVLDYSIITGQSIITQHFLSETNRDNDLIESINYADITFISLSQFDYTNEYLESLIIDLIEFRKNYNKITIISYDVLNNTKSNYFSLTQKLHSYFSTNNFQILDLLEANTVQLKQVPSKKPSARIK